MNEIRHDIAAIQSCLYRRNCIPADIIEKEKDIARAQLTGKPANIIEKIVDGKIGKYYTEVCLMDQPWIMDDKTSLAKLQPNLKVLRFLRWEVGEDLD